MTRFALLLLVCLTSVAIVPPASALGDSLSILAQDDSDGAGSGPATPRGAVVTEQSRSYVVEALGFAVLCGAALFAVCRTSHRGR